MGSNDGGDGPRNPLDATMATRYIVPAKFIAEPWEDNLEVPIELKENDRWKDQYQLILLKKNEEDGKLESIARDIDDPWGISLKDIFNLYGAGTYSIKLKFKGDETKPPTQIKMLTFIITDEGVLQTKRKSPEKPTVAPEPISQTKKEPSLDSQITILKLNNEIATLVGDKKRLEEDIKDLETDIAKANNSFDSEKRIWEKEKGFLEEREKKLDGDLKAMEAKLKENEVNHKDELRDLKDELKETAATDIKRLTDEFNNKLEGLRTEYNTKIEGANNEINRQKDLNADLRQENLKIMLETSRKGDGDSNLTPLIIEMLKHDRDRDTERFNNILDTMKLRQDFDMAKLQLESGIALPTEKKKSFLDDIKELLKTAADPNTRALIGSLIPGAAPAPTPPTAPKRQLRIQNKPATPPATPPPAPPPPTPPVPNNETINKPLTTRKIPNLQVVK